ncbi:MAG: HAD-IA family hydrolase [Lachnospiraceae bacterium]|nr:HAD-IA family hydrolase [Lachnospiraceae bacterium]
MKYKAVIFDLFETLVTEWGHKKYTKKEMCADLGIEKDTFDIYWKEKGTDRYLGNISFEESILYVFEKCEKQVEKETIAKVIDERIRTKAECFAHIDPDVIELLKQLKELGLKTAIISNCSSEEVKVLKESELYKYFDEVVLSYEVHMKKPDVCIYEKALKRLSLDANECLFVGDGGSNELEGAKNAGLKAIQAKWYTDQFPIKRDNIEGFQVAEKPMDILKISDRILL